MWHFPLTRREMLATLAAVPLASGEQPDKATKEGTNMNDTPATTTRPGETPPYDVIIVGGSYAGLSAAMQIVRARRQVLILDAGKPRNRFTHHAHGFFGQDGRTPREMIETARKQVMAYPTARFERAEVTDAERNGSGFAVRFGDKTARASRLLLATGVTDHLPDVPGMKELWGTGVAHCPYCHGYEVAGRPIAIFGVGEKSLHQAQLLRDWSDDVTLLVNGGSWLTPEHRELLGARGVKIATAPVARLKAKGIELEAVEFQDGRRLPFGAMFVAPRITLTSSLAAQLGCEIEEGMSGPMIKTDAFKETTVAGVYAAGDAARAMHSATFASADGVAAGSAAHQSLVFPKKRS